MFLLKKATKESEAQHIGLYIEQAAIQGGWTKYRHTLEKENYEILAPIRKVSLAYNVLLRLDSKANSLISFCGLAGVDDYEALRFKRDYDFLIRAIDYARSLLLKTDTIYEHEKQMKDFDIQMLIYFSEMRYNNRETPYDFNCYNEHEYKKIINQRLVDRIKKEQTNRSKK